MDTQKDKATPRPWKATGNISIIDADGMPVCRMHDVVTPSREMIVKAVNNYDTLLEACKEAYKSMKLIQPEGNVTKLLIQAINQATK